MNVYKRLKAEIGKPECAVGFLSKSDLHLPTMVRFEKIQWLDIGQYNEGWFADPFFLSVNNTIIELLVEEYIYKSSKGRLSKLSITRDGYKLLKREVVLELSTHLSYPIIYRENNKIYVYPENSESGVLKIYEYNAPFNQLENPTTIIKEPLLDAQLTKICDKYYIFAVKNATGTYDDTKTLFIYISDAILGPFTLFQTIHNSLCEERGAGGIFNEKVKLIRPAQSCEDGVYGKETILYELKFENNFFSEIEIARIDSDKARHWGLGLHTLNEMNGLCVVDGRDYHHYRIARSIKWLTK